MNCLFGTTYLQRVTATYGMKQKTIQAQLKIWLSKAWDEPWCQYINYFSKQADVDKNKQPVL